jgi:hypothetical protein
MQLPMFSMARRVSNQLRVLSNTDQHSLLPQLQHKPEKTLLVGVMGPIPMVVVLHTQWEQLQ